MASLAEKLESVHPKVLAAQIEADRKPLAEDWKRLMGQSLERALMLARLTKQDVSYRMGYEDQSALSRWISGVERPQFDKLWAVEELRQPLVQCLAELAGADVQVEIRFKRTA